MSYGIKYPTRDHVLQEDMFNGRTYLMGVYVLWKEMPLEKNVLQEDNSYRGTCCMGDIS